MPFMPFMPFGLASTPGHGARGKPKMTFGAVRRPRPSARLVRGCAFRVLPNGVPRTGLADALATLGNVAACEQGYLILY